MADRGPCLGVGHPGDNKLETSEEHGDTTQYEANVPLLWALPTESWSRTR